MSRTLHLTAAEIELYDALPAGVRRKYDMQEETLDEYETAEELALRRRVIAKNDPRLGELFAKLEASKAQDLAAAMAEIGPLPRDLLSSLFFAMGAAALGGAIVALLPQVVDADGMQALYEFSGVRHALLASNVTDRTA